MKEKITVRITRFIQQKTGKFKKYRHWGIVVLSFVVYAVVGLSFLKAEWLNSFLAIGGIALTVIFSIAYGIDNSKEIAANTKKQLKSIAENTERQIQAISENTEKQIKALAENTDRHISEFKKSTNLQISEYKNETQKQIEELKNNSILLAGILQNNLEDAIHKTSRSLNSATHELIEAQGFKFLRTNDEKVQEVHVKSKTVDIFKEWLDYYQDKRSRIMNFIAGNNNNKTIK